MLNGKNQSRARFHHEGRGARSFVSSAWFEGGAGESTRDSFARLLSVGIISLSRSERNCNRGPLTKKRSRPNSDNENKTRTRSSSSPFCHSSAIACTSFCVISCSPFFLLFRLLMLFLVLIEVLTEKAYHKAECAISFALWERVPHGGGG